MITAFASIPALDQLLTVAELVPGIHGQWSEVSVPGEQRVGCCAHWVSRCSTEMLAVGTGTARESVLVGPGGVKFRERTDVVGAFIADHVDAFPPSAPNPVDKLRVTVCVKTGRYPHGK